ncbi:MAG TPA: hypothetical protein VF525_10010 [Pyrinomonadaceae bacterium]|jgi:hypothetical protein
MAQDKKHDVKVQVQVMELSKAGTALTLEIYAEGEKLGEIEIGHGSFGWRRANSKSGFRRRNWSVFTDWLNEQFYKS